MLKNVSINYMRKTPYFALGHASLNTSRIYTHFDNDKLKLAAQVAKELSDS